MCLSSDILPESRQKCQIKVIYSSNRTQEPIDYLLIDETLWLKNTISEDMLQHSITEIFTTSDSSLWVSIDLDGTC